MSEHVVVWNGSRNHPGGAQLLVEEYRQEVTKKEHDDDAFTRAERFTVPGTPSCRDGRRESHS